MLDTPHLSVERDAVTHARLFLCCSFTYRHLGASLVALQCQGM